MTRFMMSIDDAVDLVLYAFSNAQPGDLFVQKAPAATIETLALALRQVFDADNPIKIIGTRHGEKQFETLLTREEMLRAVDHGGYYRIPADNRDLNYDAYFTEGIEPLSQQEDYNSHNTRRLSVDEMAEMLRGLEYIRGQRSEVRRSEVRDQRSEVRDQRSEVRNQESGDKEQRSVNILVTGSNGFIGKNLVAWLGRLPDVRVLEFDQEHTLDELGALLAQADIVYHLAGVNRPQTEAEFTTGNVDLTAQLCDRLLALGRATPVVLSSSIQAELDNPYGISKRQAEAVVARYAEASGARCTIFRLQNVFGKWCRPNYNSVVATFCHNIAHDLPITYLGSQPGAGAGACG